MKPKVIVILGPTATGKSDVAVEIAKKVNGEIISADSRQVYKGMDLGSGKITKEEMSNIPHHLLDVLNPKKLFSVVKYKELAEEAIENIISKNKVPIICGGTGFYIDSIVNNVTLPKVEINTKLRKSLEKKSVEQLYEILRKLSPTRAKNIDKHNKVRLVRAIEIAKELGNVPKIIAGPKKYDFIFIGLDTDDKTLKERISIRLFARIRAGMINEIKKLHEQGVSWKRLESFGLEYRQTALFLQKKITLNSTRAESGENFSNKNVLAKNQMIENLNKEIWHFVKRQRTWFKRNKQINWLDPQDKNVLKKSINIIRKAMSSN